MTSPLGSRPICSMSPWDNMGQRGTAWDSVGQRGTTWDNVGQRGTHGMVDGVLVGGFGAKQLVWRGNQT